MYGFVADRPLVALYAVFALSSSYFRLRALDQSQVAARPAAEEKRRSDCERIMADPEIQSALIKIQSGQPDGISMEQFSPRVRSGLQILLQEGYLTAS
jgi:hypothetical protein